MNEKELKILARLIAAETTRELVNFEDVCAMLRYSKDAVAVRKIVKLPDFPKPIQFVAGRGKRWRKKDVVHWIEKKSRAALSSNSPLLSQAV